VTDWDSFPLYLPSLIESLNNRTIIKMFPKSMRSDPEMKPIIIGK